MLSRRLRPPPGDREVLVRPALAEMPTLVAHNHDRLGRLDVPILGQPFQSVRAAAREAFAGSADLVVQTGHQPTPFHAGVWIKNFLTNHLARHVGAVPLNVIVDNDAAKHLELRIPRPTPDGRAVVTRVPLIDPPPEPEVPYEECPAPTADRLKAIGRVAADACPHDGMREGFEHFWRLVREVHRPGQSIAELLTDARRRLEMAAGLNNREILMSEMSTSRPFRLLLLHILADARRFVEVHNAALADYRRANRIRNRANPVPDLVVETDLVELPYWVWRRGAGVGPQRRLLCPPTSASQGSVASTGTHAPARGERRGRLTARIGKETIELRRGDETILAASRRELLDAETGPALLAKAADRGWRIRPRALTTTMFCRLFVADVFIHGIGGAAYDRVTDRIIRGFLGVEPPPHIVCSATVRLPLGAHGASVEAIREKRRLVRDLTHNPDRHLDETQAQTEPFRSLVARKWNLIGQPRGPTPAKRRDVFQNIRQVNASVLAAGLSDRVLEVQRTIECLGMQLAADAVLTSREYAFCLFPPGVLPAFYDEALAGIAP